MRREIGYGTALNYGRDANERIMTQEAMCTSRMDKMQGAPRGGCGSRRPVS
jgi:hypothetical protein